MVRKHEIRKEEKIVELYPDGYSRKWREYESVPVEHYIAKHKEHEARRASFNERAEYWKTYKKYLKNTNPETGFNMNDF